jgi:hypothetical protein
MPLSSFLWVCQQMHKLLHSKMPWLMLRCLTLISISSKAKRRGNDDGAWSGQPPIVQDRPRAGKYPLNWSVSRMLKRVAIEQVHNRSG